MKRHLILNHQEMVTHFGIILPKAFYLNDIFKAIGSRVKTQLAEFYIVIILVRAISYQKLWPANFISKNLPRDSSLQYYKIRKIVSLSSIWLHMHF